MNVFNNVGLGERSRTSYIVHVPFAGRMDERGRDIGEDDGVVCRPRKVTQIINTYVGR